MLAATWEELGYLLHFSNIIHWWYSVLLYVCVWWCGGGGGGRGKGGGGREAWCFINLFWWQLQTLPGLCPLSNSGPTMLHILMSWIATLSHSCSLCSTFAELGWVLPTVQMYCMACYNSIMLWNTPHIHRPACRVCKHIHIHNALYICMMYGYSDVGSAHLWE